MAYGLTRPLVMGEHAMVVSGHPLASMSGVRMLMAGGNAVDAAVATAAALAVIEPSMSGLGGVGSLLLYLARTREVVVLDFVGRAPHSLDPQRYGPLELRDGPLSPIVPGCVGGWLTALERYGTLPRQQVFQPALEFAEAGFPLSLQESEIIANNTGRLSPFAESTRALMGQVDHPRPGVLMRQSDLARTLRAIMEGGTEAFYLGPVARNLAASVQARGGFLSEEDLAGFEAVWLAPIQVPYRNYGVWTPPPPGAGFQYLEVLRIAREIALERERHNSARYIHLLAEAIKLAAEDRIRYATAFSPPLETVLSVEHARASAARVDRVRAQPGPGDRFGEGPASLTNGPREELSGAGHTTHLSVVDEEGNAVSLTQSLGWFFGSGMVAGNTGVLLNNFMYWFDLDPASPNFIGPGKKVEMCLAPCIVTEEDRLALVLGTPGGWGIVQAMPQMLINYLSYGMNVQTAIEALRFQVLAGTGLMVENELPPRTRRQLAQMGHQVHRVQDVDPQWRTSGTLWRLGGGIGIAVNTESGVRSGGADPRREGYAIGY